MRLRGEQGQTGAELVGVLLLVAVIVGAIATSGTGEAIASETKRLVCQIAGSDCASEPPEGKRPTDPDDPPQGRPLTAQPLPVLPFPGSVSVSCTYSEKSPAACQPSDKPGVSVETTGSLTVDRSQTSLDEEGCPQQTLSVSGKLELAANASAKGAKAGGKLSAHLGKSTKFQVTVPPDEADAIGKGERSAPNPVDPRTIRAGESVQLSEEYYAGVGMEAEYRALQAKLGYDKGTRVSSGVTRVSPTTVRVMVGDEKFVRQALSVGVGVDGASISIGGEEELASGKLHAVDIDISTPEGWSAYQEFVDSGALPKAGTAGTSDPTSADTLNYSDNAKIEAQIGNVTVGGQLGDSEGHRTETRHADGSVDTVITSRYNDVGLAVRRKHDASGNEVGEPGYSLLLEGVDHNMYETLQQLDGDKADAPSDGNLRIDFSASDLQEFRQMALERLADKVAMNGKRPTTEEIAESLADGDGVVEYDGVEYAFGAPYTDLAQAKTPEDVLIALYHLGVGGNADQAAEELAKILLASGKQLPGDAKSPDCN